MIVVTHNEKEELMEARDVPLSSQLMCTLEILMIGGPMHLRTLYAKVET